LRSELNYQESHLDDGTRLVELGGELDLSTASAEVQELLEECAESACHVALDLSGVTFIDSAGLALLVKTDRRLSAAGRRLVLLRPHPNVQRILEITGLDRRLPVEPSWSGAGPPAGQ
jgi:anti-anti-sigma factor